MINTIAFICLRAMPIFSQRFEVRFKIVADLIRGVISNCPMAIRRRNFTSTSPHAITYWYPDYL